MVMLIDELSPTARDLLRDLPDMLSGKEPFLTSAAAKRALREDPGCKEVLLAIADLTSAFESVERRPRIDSRSTLEAKRVVARLRVGQIHTLAMAFWAAALDDYLEAISGSRLVFVTGHRESVAPEHAARIASARAVGVSPRESMETFLRAFDGIRPRDPAARFLRASLADGTGSAVSPYTWLEIARATSLPGIRSACFLHYSIAMSGLGRHESALAWAESALLLEDRVEFAYDLVLIAFRSANQAAASRAVRSFESHWSKSNQSQQSLIRAAFLDDAGTWSRMQRGLDSAMRELWSVLGAE
jgi:hypothetical protein